MTILRSSTHPRWFAASTADLASLLSDHLHCERKAAENALMLVRRYPHRGTSVASLSRLAHEETSHVVQVGALIAARGWVLRSDSPNHYARNLLAEVRSDEPGRLLDALFVAAFIEARSHERLALLARGFSATGQAELASFYGALANAEERHCEIFLELARPLVPADAYAWRLEELALREAEILAALPLTSRVH
ncbi:MAG TPA: tRNA isopentenyl-2-thiomethyl-A-37 hydroxylase MiaE [Polyangia bacterium]|jgi:tRNA-(ms[2]io[6]A)-hydroxylase|nr:tRNA isopentenyl-2-thiomethyl-A-37 hydroxylase MiaE [Polyangia bacterium]